MAAAFSPDLAGAILWLFGAVATDMVAIYALVRSCGFRNIGFAALSIGSIALSFFCLRHSVLVIPLAVAYALWCVFGIFGTLFMGRVVFGQRLSRSQLLGVLLLTLGTLFMSIA